MLFYSNLIIISIFGAIFAQATTDSYETWDETVQFGKTYLFDPIGRDYDTSKSWCESHSSQLVLPRSVAENEYLISQNLIPFWIGVPSSTLKLFNIDLNGRPLIWTNWNAGEPEAAPRPTPAPLRECPTRRQPR